MRLCRRLLALALAAMPAIASALPFDVQIFDRTEGRVLPTYEFQGRTYVIGRPGNEYALTLRNGGGERVLAVSSVDGVNIITGQTASTQQSGYVLAPGQSAEINGWRKSMSNTAAFYFTQHENSYAARTGRPNDVGVIGIALYRERAAPPTVAPYPYRRDRNETPGSPMPQQENGERRDAPAADAGSSGAGALARPMQKSLGTGHGRSEQSETRYTDFQRASSTPDQVITLYYDTYSSLLAMGVPVWRDDARYATRKPQARPFPRDPTLGFVPDPR